MRQAELLRDVSRLNDLMIACNPRDLEAAHRAEVTGIFTNANPDRVTCRKCLAAIRP